MPRTRLNALLVLLAFATPVAAAPQPRPRLIVAISVDQFAASLFDRYRALYAGGLKRMASGVTFTGYQSHAATETCPGHSTLLTGMHPNHTGIAGNSWIDRATGRSTYCVSVPGAADPDARGPQNMAVDTFGDWLKRSERDARVVAVSGKDRAAITMGGHHADAVYWWIDGQGFGTSAAGEPATAAITAPASLFNRALADRWRQHPPALWPAAVPADCLPLETPHRFGAVTMSGTLPPEGAQEAAATTDPLASRGFADQLRASPLFDRLTLDFAWDRIQADHLGRGPATDLLAVSLSATDYVGHRYGNGGAEMCAQVHALDSSLGTFFTRLDALHIPYLVVLTADHGAIDAAERAASDAHLPAVRIDTRALVAALNTDLQSALRLDTAPIAGGDPEQLVIRLPAGRTKDQVRDRAVTWLRARPEVAAVFTADEIARATPPPGTRPDRLTLLQRFAESFVPGRSGDVAVAYKDYATLGVPTLAGDTVAGHGSPWDYDRRVPILWWWPGVTPERRGEPVETVDIAPTLAAIAEVPAPPVDGRCLPAVTACR